MQPAAFFRKMLFIGLVLSCTTGSAQTAPVHTTAALNAPNLKAIRGWYDAWLNKDWNSLTQVLDPGFTFSSPLDDHINLKTVNDRCWSNAYKMKKVDIDKVIVDGDNAMVIANGWTTGDKLFRNCDYFKLKNGKITAYECFFGPGVNFPNSGK